MPTAAISAVLAELTRRQGDLNTAGPVVVCRGKNINGSVSKDWSEHAYGNAADCFINGRSAQKPFVDELNRMKAEGYPVGWIGHAGNRPKDHTDHIHIEGSPALAKSGPPPCAGGKTKASASDVKTGDSDIKTGDPDGGAGGFLAGLVPGFDGIQIEWARIGTGAVGVAFVAIGIFLVVREVVPTAASAAGAAVGGAARAAAA